MGGPLKHWSITDARLLYDHETLYIHFRVEDHYVVATEKHHQGDSRVEFFFTPTEDTEPGYFNIEIIYVGTMLFHHQWNGAWRKS